MRVKKSTLKQMQIGGFLFLFAVFGVLGLVIMSTRPAEPNATGGSGSNNVTVDANGNQIITIDAKVGYSPRVTKAEAGKPTILRMATKNTFDCSAALSIPSLGVREFLPPNGNTDIQIAAQPAGTTINATCSMGMYSFQIKFV